MADPINVVNAIRNGASPTYQERVPVATRNNIEAVANPLFEYQATMNEFLSSLVNRIGLTVVRSREFKNPLSVLKQGEIPLGKDIEEIWTNPAKASTFNPTATGLLSRTLPDTKAIFHRLNRQDKYTVSVSNPQLRQAFTSWDSLEGLISTIIGSLYNGNYIDELVLCKRTLASAITDGNIKTETVSALSSEANAKAFISKAREYFINFALPSSNYNAYTPASGEDPVITWTPNEDVRFIMRSDVASYVDVNVLASAFNMDKANFLGKTLVIDNFGEGGENCLAMMIDKSYTQIYDNYREMTEFFNGETLTWNYYYHVWQTYSVSTLCNAVAFVTA